MTKNNIRSIRFSDDIADMINRQAGETFTEKFERLVTSAYWELPQKQKEIKANSAKTQVKEIHMGSQTDDHDFNFKLNHATKFLSDGYKVKVVVSFRGRSIIYKDQGELLLLRFAQSLEDYGKLDQMPTLLGKNMTIMLSPKSKK